MISQQPSRTAMYRWVWGTLALSLLTASASAQGFPFTLRLQQGSAVTTITNNSTVTLVASAIGKTATATLTITNQNAGPVTIPSQPTLSQLGQDFSANAAPTPPRTLNQGDAITVTLQFTPSLISTETATFTLAYTQGGASGSVQLNLNGITPSLNVTYVLPTNNNTVQLPPGGTLQFPPVQVNASMIATVTVSNAGQAQGSVDAVTTQDGTPFQLVQLPPLPAAVRPGGSVTFGVKYAPTQAGNDTGTLTITLNGTPSTFTLAGSGISSSYSYVFTDQNGNNQTINPGGQLVFQDVPIGGATSYFATVKNIGSASGVINLISATGVFSVTDGPTVFPVTLNPNELVTFTVTFKPQAPGKATGKLTVGNAVFDLQGTGLGPTLIFSYGPPPSVQVQPSGLVVFPSTAVGNSSQQPFSIKNTGTATITFTSIAVADTKGVFKLLNGPTGPSTLNPGETLTFTIVFTPTLTGFSTTTLQVDTNLFNLQGSGTAPPQLPDFQFTGPSGNVTALQQVAIGITLSAPYPMALTGTLTLTMNSATFAPDPSVQFPTGKTVSFTIPANAMQAVFPSGGNTIPLQTGSTAGSITVTPTFATQAGLDLTPQPAPTLTFNVPAAAPQLLRIQITSVSQAGFVVGVTGLTTTHSLSTLTYQFTPTGNGKPSTYMVDVSTLAGLWFNSAASAPFGGQFSVAVPFALSNPSATALATANLKSVSVTITNAQGTSSPLSFSFQ